jgi:protein subunit release factor A
MTQSPNLWNDPDRAKVVSKEKSDTEKLVNSFNSISQQVGDIETALELYNSEKDEEFLKEAIATVEKLVSRLLLPDFPFTEKAGAKSVNTFQYSPPVER